MRRCGAAAATSTRSALARAPLRPVRRSARRRRSAGAPGCGAGPPAVGAPAPAPRPAPARRVRRTGLAAPSLDHRHRPRAWTTAPADRLRPDRRARSAATRTTAPRRRRQHARDRRGVIDVGDEHAGAVLLDARTVPPSAAARCPPAPATSASSASPARPRPCACRSASPRRAAAAPCTSAGEPEASSAVMRDEIQIDRSRSDCSGTSARTPCSTADRRDRSRGTARA